MAKILIADDEQLIRKLIGDYLRKEDHEVLEAENGEEALNIFEENKDIALAMLDIMMPEIDGWEVCRRIREKSDMPVMLVSARSQDFDQIMGFESGADDYVTKPFSLTVLAHRVETLLKRGTNLERRNKKSDEIVVNGLIIKPSSYEVELDGQSIDLTLKEFNILLRLAQNPGRVYTRGNLLDELWGYDYVGDTRTVDSHVARLRTKLGAWGLSNIITVYGTGYKLKEND